MNWEEPGPAMTGKAHTRIRWADEAQALRENPKRWAKLATKPTVSAAAGMANQVTRGRLRAFLPARHFESTVRGTDVYVRYVGEGT